jgi:small conductance mechanosensitive channel
MNKWLDILEQKVSGWWVAFLQLLPNIVLAAVVVFVFFFVAKWVRRISNNVLLRMSGKVSVSGLFSTTVYLVIIFIGLFCALDIVGLDKTVSSLLAGAGIMGLILGFALQDVSSNFVSGFFIALKKPFEVGQTVETNGFVGNIESIQLRSTTIRTFQGLHLMIPNKDIFQKPMINYSRTSERRIELSLAIANDSDLAVAEKSVMAGMQQLSWLHKEKKPEVYFTGFEENTIKMDVWFWIYNHEPPGYMVAQHEAILQIVRALRKANVSLSVPVTFQRAKTRILKTEMT